MSELKTLKDCGDLGGARIEAIKWVKYLISKLDEGKICEKCGRKMVLNSEGEMISTIDGIERNPMRDWEFIDEVNISCPKYFEWKDDDGDDYDNFVEGHSDIEMEKESISVVCQILWIKYFFNITEDDLKC